VPNPGLRSNFWVRLPTTYLSEDIFSVSEREERVQFKKSMGTMTNSLFINAFAEQERNTGVQQITALPKRGFAAKLLFRRPHGGPKNSRPAAF
jgi:hypothetical protein